MQRRLDLQPHEVSGVIQLPVRLRATRIKPVRANDHQCGHTLAQRVYQIIYELHPGRDIICILEDIRSPEFGSQPIIAAPTKGSTLRPSIGDEDLRHECLCDVLCQTDEKQALQIITA
jgi:hypothetical protein